MDGITEYCPLDNALQGSGLGGVLLVDALTRGIAAGTHVGVRFVVVDAIDDAAAGFYQAHGFRLVPKDPHRLVREASSIAADLTDTGV